MVIFKINLKKILDRVLFDIVLILVCAIILISFNLYMFQVVESISNSMEPTILSDSKLVINNFIYRFNMPERDDIVIFTPHNEPTFMSKGYFKKDVRYVIKRIIGVAGDEIEVKEGQLYVNDIKQEENFIKEKMNYKFGPVKVPKGYVLLLGDNRNDSFDSHLWEKPFVPIKNIKGKVIKIYQHY